MNRLVVLVLAAVLLAETSAFAQEREPLVMRIELEWSLAGTLAGALIGTAVWITDPANPNNSLAKTSIEGAALGTVAGALFGLYVVNRNAILPQSTQAAVDTPPSLWNTGADPVAVRDRREALMGSVAENRPTIVFSTLRLHF